jgi:hypothetical protein
MHRRHGPWWTKSTYPFLALGSRWFGLTKPLPFSPLAYSARAVALPSVVALARCDVPWLGRHPKRLNGFAGTREGYGVVITTAWGSEGDLP